MTQLNANLNPPPISVPLGGECRFVSFESLGDRLAATLVLPAERPAPIMLVTHGAGESRSNYGELASALAEGGFAALLIDMHGHGESGGKEHHVRMTEWTADLTAALDFVETLPEIDSSRVAGFGLSSGGTAILESASTDLRWKALVALDPTVKNTLPCWVTAVIHIASALGWVKAQFTGKDLHISIISLLNQVALASDPEINNRLKSDPGKLRAFANFPLPGAAEAFLVDTIRRVHTIKAPTMVIWGEDDELDPVSTGELLFSRLTCEKEWVLIPGNGHAGHLDRHRHQVFQNTLDWLKKQLS